MKSLIATLLLCFSLQASAGVVATLPNQAGGKIVITDEECKHEGQTYTALRKAYNYGSTGDTSNGCWYLDDETIVIIWKNANNTASTRRYPLLNFDIRKKGSNS
jgi:hypothetical protein